jgi:hypothetical protein
MGGHVFGASAHLQGKITATVFSLLLLALVFLEAFFKYLEQIAVRTGYADIFNKLKSELLMMGILSLTVFVVQTLAEIPATSERFMVR